MSLDPQAAESDDNVMDPTEAAALDAEEEAYGRAFFAEHGYASGDTATDGQHRHNSLIRMAYECPRCLHLIPNDDMPGAYPGALSRANNETEVCSVCGTDEAMGNGPIPSEQWPVHIDQSVYDGAALQRKQFLDMQHGV